jgi:protein TonB
MKAENLMETSHSPFLAGCLSLPQVHVPAKRYSYLIAALSSSVLIHLMFGWFLLHLGKVPSQRRILPIEVTIVTPAPQKEPIPPSAPVVPKVAKPVRSAPRALPASVPVPSAAPRPTPVVARVTPAPEPAKVPEKTIPPAHVVPAASLRETAIGVSQPLNAPSVQSAQTHASTLGATRGAYDPKAASEAQPVIGPSFDAAYLSNPVPKYPAAARRLKLQGTATVRVLVSPEGRPRSVALSKSSGTRILDEAALEAVQQWSFVPARRGSKPVAAEVDVPVRFRLN